ncbi:non-homologous end-joining DNA ligase [Blastococcus sp. Marseille-P5729]|uniref:non-homologous end-joining DNA ligase n=1 Tax=Blastococcus sp. Marseille-P5729 TaxID=2086582 RepID=UPI000D0E89CE|nr:non-homologous end-joining DNA ligase [Blastococcus sp. Marseille-P5729]
MPSASVTLDVDGHKVKVSSPERVCFPKVGITKLQIVEYYLAVGKGILGAVRDRPTTLERWPKGVIPLDPAEPAGPANGDFFYQKHVPKGLPAYAETVDITFPSGRSGTEICPSNLATVVWAAHMNTITFHPWPVTRAAVDQPDQLRIDLDPQPGTDFTDAVRAGDVLREVLAEHDLHGFPKTSGGRGLHVYVPIRPQWSFVETRRALIAIGREMERRTPELVTLSWWKEERGERIFIDYNQMARDRTIASAYSVRANDRATVSAPLTWDELADAAPDDFTVRTMPARFAEVGDLHARVASAQPGDLASLLELSAKQESDLGLGDLPYPPDYPKMPGEPPRVQPSRKNPANW